MKRIINRKNILILLAVIFIVSIAYIGYSFNLSRNKPTASEKFQQNLAIPNYLAGTTITIENDIKSSDFKFPSQLPYLQQTNINGLSDAAANTIAINLGFKDAPTISTDVQNGEVIIWNGDQYSLVATPKINTVQLSSNTSARILVQNVTGKKISDSDYQALAQSFLTEKIGLNSASLKFTGFSYFKVANGVEYLANAVKSDAQIVQLNYSEGPSTYPILTPNPDEPQILVQILKDGSIMSFKGDLGLIFKNSPNQYPILDYNQFSQNLNKSIVVSVNNNSVNLPDLNSKSLSGIKVDRVSLAYLIDKSGATVIQPVFLIEGTTELNGVAGTVSISLYLPAFQSLTQP